MKELYILRDFNCLSNCLQFTSKQMEQLAKKAEKDQKVQQAKVKKVSLDFLSVRVLAIDSGVAASYYCVIVLYYVNIKTDPWNKAERCIKTKGLTSLKIDEAVFVCH